jgi:DNA-binding XRE family transcriptional regulator
MGAVMQSVVSLDVGDLFENQRANRFLLLFRQGGNFFNRLFQLCLLRGCDWTDRSFEDNGGSFNNWNVNNTVMNLATQYVIWLMQIKNICLLLSLGPIHVSRPYRPFPRHWKSNQQHPAQPKTLGEQIKGYRLELGWFQREAAIKIGISSTSLSNWERGVTRPSRRMKKKIQDFLEYTPVPIPKQQHFSACQICGISEVSSERCLFENLCNKLD